MDWIWSQNRGIALNLIRRHRQHSIGYLDGYHASLGKNLINFSDFCSGIIASFSPAGFPLSGFY
jgi:hypothetical protein